MRKTLVIATIVLLSFTLSACGSPTTSAIATHSQKPIPSATPKASAAPVAAKPASVTPLVPLVDPDILTYCPATPAIHLDVKANTITKADICTSVPTSSGGTTESASVVNFGLDALLSAYAQPNQTVTGNCSNQALDPLIVWLTDSTGKVFSVYAPVDGCGLPTSAAADAYQSAGLQILYSADLDANGQPTGQ
ncbi:MAG: hypothetical protein JWO01_1761 [Microbacteriaceae bacterium]|nr:hypothetical protein [Microbacteriaceae bacterium]